MSKLMRNRWVRWSLLIGVLGALVVLFAWRRHRRRTMAKSAASG
jgi:hypothetical protein